MQRRPVLLTNGGDVPHDRGMASTGELRASEYRVRVNLRRWLLSGYDPETGRLYLSIPHYTRRGALRTLYWQDRLAPDYAIDFRIEKVSWRQ